MATKTEMISNSQQVMRDLHRLANTGLQELDNALERAASTSAQLRSIAGQMDAEMARAGCADSALAHELREAVQGRLSASLAAMGGGLDALAQRPGVVCHGGTTARNEAARADAIRRRLVSGWGWDEREVAARFNAEMTEMMRESKAAKGE